VLRINSVLVLVLVLGQLVLVVALACWVLDTRLDFGTNRKRV